MRHPNRLATRRTINALSATGRLEQCDAALVGLAQATADLVDTALADPAAPAHARAAVGRLHLATLLALTGKVTADADAGLSEVIAALSAQMGDAPES